MKASVICLLAAALALPAMAKPLQPPQPIERAEGEGYNPVPPAHGFNYPDCYCTDTHGIRVEIGQTACLTVGSESFLARCGMSLNSPAWRRLKQECPSV